MTIKNIITTGIKKIYIYSADNSEPIHYMYSDCYIGR